MRRSDEAAQVEINSLSSDISRVSRRLTDHYETTFQELTRNSKLFRISGEFRTSQNEPYRKLTSFSVKHWSESIRNMRISIMWSRIFTIPLWETSHDSWRRSMPGKRFNSLLSAYYVNMQIMLFLYQNAESLQLAQRNLNDYCRKKRSCSPDRTDSKVFIITIKIQSADIKSFRNS